MNDNDEVCKKCGHSINWHRFSTKFKPTACLHTKKIKTNSFPFWQEDYCKCNKFEYGADTNGIILDKRKK